jgi:flavin reductase (DIM6/NTAB) family NADH-FMN oxidoreductase RutF
MGFENYDWRSGSDNTWKLIADDWMLITAGEAGAWNTMTASWGGFGHLWNRDVAFVFVRPTRHSFGFMERAEGFTLSFFDPEQRSILQVCGSTSGADTDKAAAAGISPRVFGSPAGTGSDEPPPRIAFSEARLVFSCRKLHAQDLDPAGFIDRGIDKHYPKKDWHRMYVGAIEKAWKRA